MVNINSSDFSVVNTLVKKLQHGRGNFSVLLYSQCVAICHPFGLELVWKFIKVKQRSTLNLSYILKWTSL